MYYELMCTDSSSVGILFLSCRAYIIRSSFRTRNPCFCICKISENAILLQIFCDCGCNTSASSLSQKVVSGAKKRCLLCRDIVIDVLLHCYVFLWHEKQICNMNFRLFCFLRFPFLKKFVNINVNITSCWRRIHTHVSPPSLRTCKIGCRNFGHL